MSSYEEINYRLRPAKSIERKMLSDAFRRLSPFGKVDSYRYVGFGSIYFTDFSLFYKNLGIEDMISIEKNKDDDERVEFNKPYKFIDVLFGDSNDELSNIPWSSNSRSIIWLDYDGKLTSSVLKDISYVCSQAAAGSIILVSVNAKFSFNAPGPIEELKENVGLDHVDPTLINTDFAGWGGAEVYRGIINSVINETLKDRNGGLTANCQLDFQQLFNFRYEDGARMLTTGGIICDNGQKSILNSCGFDQLDFFRSEADAFLIHVPCLTFKEINFLDKNLPIEEAALDSIPIPNKDITYYEKVRRYFPNFIEGEL